MIEHWCNRWLNLGGRLILIKSVLEIVHMYWMSLANIPSEILDRIKENVAYLFG